MVKQFLQDAWSGLTSLLSGKYAARSRARREELKKSLKEAGETNKSAREAYDALKNKQHWTDMSRGQLMEQGMGTLLGSLAKGGGLKSVVKPDETWEKLGKGIGKAANYAIDAPGAPKYLGDAATFATGAMQGKAKETAASMALDKAKGLATGVLKDRLVKAAPTALGKAQSMFGKVQGAVQSTIPQPGGVSTMEARQNFRALGQGIRKAVSTPESGGVGTMEARQNFRALGQGIRNAFTGGGGGGGAMPSAAKGGLMRRKGKVRVHNKELMIKKGTGSLIKLMKRKGVAVPLPLRVPKRSK